MTEADPPEPPQLVQTSAQGPWNGPSYRYRGAEIHCLPGGHVCGLVMRDHPLTNLVGTAVDVEQRAEKRVNSRRQVSPQPHPAVRADGVRVGLGHGAVRTAVASMNHANRRSIHMTVLFRPFIRLMQPNTKAPAPKASTCAAVSVIDCGRRG